MAAEDNVIQQLAALLNASKGQVTKRFQLDPFVFGINFLPLPASGTATGQFITQADSGFAICKTSCTVASDVSVFVANVSDIPRFAPQIITLSDSGSGRDLSNTPIALETQFGTGEWPVIWAKAKVLDPNSTFTARIQNLVATAFNIRLSFIGYKIFGDVSAFKK